MTLPGQASETAFTQDQVRSFVIAAHARLEVVRDMLAEEPALLNMMYTEWSETALGAASHVGQREIAEFLLQAGAPLTICAAAMLGRTADVAAFLEADPAQANARGAHGIPVVFHAALGGQTEVAELLLANGGGEGLKDALHGAVAKGHIEMARWLIAHGAEVNALDWRQKTPLAAAEENGDTAMADLLRQHGGTM